MYHAAAHKPAALQVNAKPQIERAVASAERLGLQTKVCDRLI
jgi:hypothetical protein